MKNIGDNVQKGVKNIQEVGSPFWIIVPLCGGSCLHFRQAPILRGDIKQSVMKYRCTLFNVFNNFTQLQMYFPWHSRIPKRVRVGVRYCCSLIQLSHENRHRVADHLHVWEMPISKKLRNSGYVSILSCTPYHPYSVCCSS